MKLYLVTRRDLSPGDRAVQSCHALIQFQHEHQDIERVWFENSNTLALLEVLNESELEQLLERARWRGVAVSAFREPDRHNELTAVAIEPAGVGICRKLPLALAS